MDDLKCSHKDTPAVDKFIEWLREMHEDDVGEVKVSRGKRHDFLGVDLDFSSDGDFKIDMAKYATKMTEDFPDDGKRTATAPAALHFFNVRDDVEKLSEEDAVLFHNLVARGLFSCKRALSRTIILIKSTNSKKHR